MVLQGRIAKTSHDALICREVFSYLTLKKYIIMVLIGNVTKTWLSLRFPLHKEKYQII